jgi:hypothetical protein
MAKLVAKYTEGMFSLCLRGRAELRAEIIHTGVEQLSSHCGKNQALHCLGETGSKLKMRVSPEKSSSLTHSLAL